jgi:hypothetical protein
MRIVYHRATAENAALAAHMEKRAPAWMAELDAREAMIDLDAIFPNSKEVCSTFRGRDHSAGELDKGEDDCPSLRRAVMRERGGIRTPGAARVYLGGMWSRVRRTIRPE